MKILAINTGWKVQQFWISNHEKADAAYAAITSAMNDYDRFSNDKNKIVSFDTGGGCLASFRCESLVSVALDDCAQTETETIERAVFEAGVRAKIAARFVPAAA